MINEDDRVLKNYKVIWDECDYFEICSLYHSKTRLKAPSREFLPSLSKSKAISSKGIFIMSELYSVFTILLGYVQLILFVGWRNFRGDIVDREFHTQKKYRLTSQKHIQATTYTYVHIEITLDQWLAWNTINWKYMQKRKHCNP